MNENKNVLIIGHRGANSIAPENTLKAFKKAIELKADFIEFDIRLSKDNETVIMHDDNTFRTTGHDGQITNMTVKELKSLDCGEGEQIPTLHEVIELTNSKIGLQIEVCAPGMAEKLVSILRENDLIESSIVSSFQYSELLNIQKLEPNLKLGLLISANVESNKFVMKFTQKAIKKEFYSIHPYYEFIDENYVNYVHNNNLKVIAYTVNNKSDIENLIKMGVNGIITDDILITKLALNS
ncbi:MAG: glycerophosphodiester phosphodiesterase [Promethearchaeota archaeon]